MAFEGGVALITGAASGMGQVAAWRLAAGGAAVAAIDVDEDGLAETAAHAPNIRTSVCDVTDEAAVRSVVAETERDLGPIDRVMNAAAIAPSGPLLDQSPEIIKRMTDVNYLGTVNVCLVALPRMIKRGVGDLVNFASLGGWIPFDGLGGYCATKFAVVAFTDVLAHENAGKGIRFACVCPPLVDTPMIDEIERGVPGYSKAPMIGSDAVITGIERSLDKGQLMVFPGRGTKSLWTIRRFFPERLRAGLDKQMAKTFADG